MSIGLGLLHCLLREDESFSALGAAGVTREFFTGDERKVYDFITEHFSKHRLLPKQSTITAETGVEFPKFPREPVGYWLDRIDRRYQIGIIARASKVMQDAAAEGSLQTAVDEIRRTYINLQNRGAIDQMVTLALASDDVIARHDQVQRSGRMSGVPFGIEYLDEVSSGAQPGDTVAIVGRPGMGKSYFIMSMSNHAYNAGEVPLLATYEMSTTQCARRILALRTNVSATMIRLGRLSFWGREKVMANIGRLQGMEDRPFHLMQGTLKSTVEDLILRIQEVKPTVVYVDGAYLLRTNIRTNSRWERVSESAEWLKMIANEFKLPVIASYQFNRRGPGSLANIGGSDAIGQLASIVLGIDDEDMEERDAFSARSHKLLELLKGREGERGVIRVLYDMERMVIAQREVISGFRSGGGGE